MSQSQCTTSIILGSGEDVPERPPLLDGNCLIIAADGGADLARKWNLVPHIIIGDGDSISDETEEHWKERQIVFSKYSAKKDYTDTELAINYAIERGCKNLILIGAWGSRIDHSLGNIELLYSLAIRKIKNRLITKNQTLIAFQDDLEIETAKGNIISLVPLTSQVEGISTQGLAYPLENSSLIKGTTLPISNEAIDQHVKIKTTEGILLVILNNKIPLDN